MNRWPLLWARRLGIDFHLFVDWVMGRLGEPTASRHLSRRPKTETTSICQVEIDARRVAAAIEALTAPRSHPTVSTGVRQALSVAPVFIRVR